MIHEAWRAGVKRLLFLGSSCIYPRDCPQPMKEEYLLSGPLEPTNLYGPGDSYDLQNSHVLPALMRKIHEAKQRGERQVTLWGSGRPRREFVYDASKPDGMPRKLLDSARIMALGWKPKVGLREGITGAYQDFLRGRTTAIA